MPRSIWKEPFSLVNQKSSFNFLQKKQSHLRFSDPIFNGKQKQALVALVWCRNAMILPSHIGNQVKIYNGKVWIFRRVTEEMVGHKFGEFCSTRKRTKHKINKIKQVRKKK